MGNVKNPITADEALAGRSTNEITATNICGVDCYEKDGTAYLKLETVARGLGFVQMKNDVEYVKWERVSSYLEELGFSPEAGKETFIPENIFYRLAMKAKNETAEKFQAKVADEIIPEIRRTGGYRTKNREEFDMCLYGVKFIADDMKIAESSRLFMYNGVFTRFGLPTDFLPQYTDNGNREQCSATELLNRNGCDSKSAKFNQLMIAAGYMELRERTSSKGEIKEYKALTDKGLKYGVNLVSNKNQKECQPYYYADTFMELYSEVTR